MTDDYDCVNVHTWLYFCFTYIYRDTNEYFMGVEKETIEKFEEEKLFKEKYLVI